MANFDIKDRAAIVGAGNSQYGRKLMRSPIDLAADAIANALEDAGLTRSELDGIIVSFGSPIGADADTIAQLLGLELRSYNQTWAHGRFTASCIIWAAMIVNAGMADAVACLASVSFSGMRRPMMGGAGDREGAREAGGGHGEDPVYGMTSPGSGAALVARRYFERYGTDSRALASVPIAFRKHASMNPAAIMREQFDVEAHQQSRYVCEPLHLLDYCLINDGAACVIVTTSERARDLKNLPSTSAACKDCRAAVRNSSGRIRDWESFSNRCLSTSRDCSQSTKWPGWRRKILTRSSPMTHFR